MNFLQPPKDVKNVCTSTWYFAHFVLKFDAGEKYGLFHVFAQGLRFTSSRTTKSVVFYCLDIT